MVSKGRHPKKPIADALADVARDGLDVLEVHRGHRWGVLVAPCAVPNWRCGPHRVSRRTLRSGVRRFDVRHRHEEEIGRAHV